MWIEIKPWKQVCRDNISLLGQICTLFGFYIFRCFEKITSISSFKVISVFDSSVSNNFFFNNGFNSNCLKLLSHRLKICLMLCFLKYLQLWIFSVPLEDSDTKMLLNIKQCYIQCSSTVGFTAIKRYWSIIPFGSFLITWVAYHPKDPWFCPSKFHSMKSERN